MYRSNFQKHVYASVSLIFKEDLIDLIERETNFRPQNSKIISTKLNLEP